MSTPADLIRDLAACVRELEARRDALEDVHRLCAQQAEDDGLWFVAQTCSEAYLQQGLRALHALAGEKL